MRSVKCTIHYILSRIRAVWRLHPGFEYILNSRDAPYLESDSINITLFRVPK
jgi:hypothetical protein